MTTDVSLPKLLHDHSKVLIEIPIRILAIIVVALIIRSILNRLIKRILPRPLLLVDRLPRNATGKLPQQALQELTATRLRSVDPA